MRLPISPPIAAPATPAATREPVEPPNLRADGRAGKRADEGAGIFARTGAGRRIARAAGKTGRDQNRRDNFHTTHGTPLGKTKVLHLMVGIAAIVCHAAGSSNSARKPPIGAVPSVMPPP